MKMTRFWVRFLLVLQIGMTSLCSNHAWANGCTGSWFDIQYSPWCDCWQVCGNYISDCDKIKSISWNFGDGTTYSGPDPCHKYQQPGNYTITMTIVAYCHNSFFGLFTQTCNITKQLNVTNIAPIIGANFSADTVCFGQSTKFQNTSSGGFGTNILYWDFGDGTTGLGQAPTHKYDSCGVYDVTLVVQNSTPCCTLSGTDTIRKKVYVNCTPNEFSNGDGKTDPYIQESTADVVVLSGTCLGDTTVFDLITTGPITSWEYFFPDSSTSNLRSPSYVYQNCPPAVGFTKVNVLTNRGCRTIIDSVTGIFCPQNITLKSTTTLCTGSCNGTATAVIGGGVPPYTITWDDPQSQTNFTAINLCQGQYKPTVTDGNGCTASPNPVTVNDFPFPFVGTATVYGNIPCHGWYGGSAILNMTGGTPPYSYYWSPTGDTTADAQNLPRNNSVTATDANGCTFTTTVIVPEPDPIGANFTVSNASCGLCNASVTVSGTGGTGAYIYNWFTAPPQNASTASNLCAGIYRVQVEDGGVVGCRDTFTIPVSEIGAQPITISSTNTLCEGVCNGTATVNLTGGCQNSPCTFAWFDSTTLQIAPTTATANGLCKGSYTVRVTNSLGCRSFATANIDVNTRINTTVTALPNSCGGNCSGLATVAPTGGGGGYSYQWYTNAGAALAGQTNASANGLCPAKYKVRVADNQGCFAWDSATIGANPLEANPSATNTLCFGDCNGMITAITLKGNQPYSYNLQNSLGATVYSGNAFIMANLCADNYTLRVTDASSCTLTFPLAITQPAAINSLVAVTQPLCFSNCNGALTATTTGGTPPYVYSWLDAASNNIGSNPAVQNLCAGNYALEVVDSNGCKPPVIPVAISQPLLLSDSLDFLFPYCNEGLGYINAIPSGGTPPYTFAWNTGASTSIISNLDTGFYRVTITDANGCSVVDSVRFNFIPELQVQTYTEWYNGYHFKCNEGSVTYLKASASGGVPPYNFQWNDSLSSNLDSLYGVPPGVYVVTVTDVLGCQKTDTLNLYIIPPKLFVSHQETPVTCFGSDDGSIHVSINGGVPAYNIFWEHDPFLNDTVLTGLSPGVYVYNVIDTNICFISDTVMITEPQPLSVVVGKDDVTCHQGADGVAWGNASGGAMPYIYTWNGGAFTGDTIRGIQAGNYTLTVRDSNNCQIAANLIVNQPDSILLNIQSVAALCFGLNGSLILNVSNAVAPINYSWSNGANTKDISDVAGSYSVQVADGKNCTAAASAAITQPDSLSVTAQVNEVACAGENSGNVILGVVGGTPNYSYQWSNNTIQKDLQNATVGSYSVTVYDNNNCTVTRTYTLTEPTALQLQLQATDAVCFGEVTGSVASAVSGGVAPYAYLWSNNTQSANLSNIGAGSYSLTVTDANNCTIVQSATVNQSAEIAINFIVLPISCFGANDGAISANVIGGNMPISYQWNGGLSTSQNIGNLSPGNYLLQVTDNTNCTSSRSVQIAEPALLMGLRNVEICQGETFFAGGANQSTSGSYFDTLVSLISNCDSILQTVLFVADTHLVVLYDTICFGEMYSFNSQMLRASGTYEALMQSAFGCDSLVRLNLTVLPDIQLSIAPNSLLMEYNERTSITVKVNQNAEVVSYLWQPAMGLSCNNCANPIITASNDVIYTLTSYDFFGCSDTANLTIKLRDPEFYVPNMFSPNGDGVNDFFFVYGKNIVEFSIKIFNRWGEKVFEANDMKLGWDGTQNGEQLPPDVFVYLVDAKFANGVEPQSYKLKRTGSLTLVR